MHDNKFWAAKIVAKSSLVDKSTKKKLLAEINIHRSLKHENIVRFVSVVEDKHNIYLILELCENKVSFLMKCSLNPNINFNIYRH